MFWFFRELLRILKEILDEAKEGVRLIRRILHILQRKSVTAFVFQQENPMIAFNPGNQPVITITPLPAGVTLTQPPVTTSSDTTNFPFTVDATGLIVTFTLGTTLGATATLTTTYTNADGTVASSTSQPWGPIVAPVTDVTGFSFAQSA